MARTRYVWDTDMVAHIWANQSQGQARNKYNNFYFIGPTIYSYGPHFPIASIVEHKGKKCVLFTVADYSTTTSSHKRIVRGAIGDMPVFHVSDVEKLDHKANLKWFAGEIMDDAKKAKRARQNKGWVLSNLEAYVNNSNKYAEFFGLKTRFTVPSDMDIAKEREKAKANAEAGERRRARERAELIKKAMERLEDWKTGKDTGGHTLYALEDTYLRVKVGTGRDGGDVLETSRGAQVPLHHATRILPLIRAGKAYQRNGHTEHVGHFALDKIDEQGNVHIGCHFVKREEIERIAAQLGL